MPPPAPSNFRARPAAFSRAPGWADSFRKLHLDIRKRLRILSGVKTRQTYEGRPCQVIWKDWEKRQIRIQYRPSKDDDTMRVLTTSSEDPKFGWSDRELDTLED